ncbi:MAG: Flp pilus assembly pilin Flp [Paracoccaceae bacterium]|jgi:Flp pilus assembly pilin Flp
MIMEYINKKIRSFKEDERGAVTVDWVVFTACVTALAIAVMATVSNGAGEVTGDLKTNLTSNVMQSSADYVIANGGYDVTIAQ